MPDVWNVFSQIDSDQILINKILWPDFTKIEVLGLFNCPVWKKLWTHYLPYFNPTVKVFSDALSQDITKIIR